MNKPYHFEIPLPPKKPSGAKYISGKYATIERCVEACKAKCKKLGVNYDDRDIMLFMTDLDGVWEVTEEGELAG